MLPKKSRISKKLFSELLKASQYINSPHLTLRFLSGSSHPSPLFGASVSKKISKSAVVRNKIRRRIYSALRPYVLKMKPGIYLFVTKTGVEKLKGENLNEELLKILKDSRQLF